MAKMASTRKLRSAVWEYFDTVDVRIGRCKLRAPPTCAIVAYHGGTTLMKSHLTNHHPDKYEERAARQNRESAQPRLVCACLCRYYVLICCC